MQTPIKRVLPLTVLTPRKKQHVHISTYLFLFFSGSKEIYSDRGNKAKPKTTCLSVFNPITLPTKYPFYNTIQWCLKLQKWKDLKVKTRHISFNVILCVLNRVFQYNRKRMNDPAAFLWMNLEWRCSLRTVGCTAKHPSHYTLFRAKTNKQNYNLTPKLQSTWSKSKAGSKQSILISVNK